MPRLRYLLPMLIAALAVRLAAGECFAARVAGNAEFEFGDSEGYWQLGKELARGQAYQYQGAQVFRMPGYPLLLAGMFRMFGLNVGPMWGRALSALLGTATVLAVAWWTSLLADAKAAAAAGWLTAFYPGAVAMGAVVLSEAPFCLLMVLQLALWGLAADAARHSESWPRTILCAGAAGVAAGAACLVRPSWLLFTPLALLAAMLFERREWRKQAAIGLFVLAVNVLILSPWWVRNWQLTGHFVPTTLQVGASLYDGLNPAADGSSEMSFVARFSADQREQDAALLEPPADSFEYRLDQRLRRAAVAWATSHPGRAVQLAFIKLARIWNVWPNEAAFRAWSVRLVVLVTYVPLALAGVYGAWRLSRSGWPYILCWLPAVYFSFLHMIFVGSLRYREPAMLGLIVLAAAACCRARPAAATSWKTTTGLD